MDIWERDSAHGMRMRYGIDAIGDTDMAIYMDGMDTAMGMDTDMRDAWVAWADAYGYGDASTWGDRDIMGMAWAEIAAMGSDADAADMDGMMAWVYTHLGEDITEPMARIAYGYAMAMGWGADYEA